MLLLGPQDRDQNAKQPTFPAHSGSIHELMCIFCKIVKKLVCVSCIPAPGVLELLAEAMACETAGFILGNGHFKLCFDAFFLGPKN